MSDNGAEKRSPEDGESSLPPPVKKVKVEESSSSASLPPVPSSSGVKSTEKYRYDDDPDWDDDKAISDNMALYLKNREARVRAAQQKQQDEERIKKEKRASSGGGTRVAAPKRLDEQFYTTTKKGELVQKLLVRWWYAFQWPDLENLTGKVPDGYEMLDGFPGVYVSMRTSNLGHILDLREKDIMCPTLRCMARKSSAEIQELCVTAYEKQIEKLKEQDGGDAQFELTLKKELHAVRRIDADLADRESMMYNFEE